MTRTVTLRLTLCICAFALLFSACRRDGETRWEIDGRVPLLKGQLSWNNLNNDSLFTPGDDGVLRLIYTQNLLNFDLDTLVAIGDTIIRKQFEPQFSGGPVMIPAGTSIFEGEENILLKTDAAQLREVRIASGQLKYTIRSYAEAQLQVEYRLPGVILPSGSNIDLDIVSGSAEGSQPWVYESAVDMSGASIDLQGVNGSSFNRLATEIDLKAFGELGVSVPIFGDDSVTIELSFTDVRVAYAKGYFGQFTSEINEEIDLSPLGVFGQLNLDELGFDLTLTNRVGADVRLDFDRITAVRNSDEVNLVHAVMNQPLNITRAIDNGGQVSGETYVIDVNQDNSNILGLFTQIPSALQIVGEVDLNPLGNVAGNNDFIYTDQPFDAEWNIDLPLCLSTGGLTLRDTLEIGSLSGDLNADAVLTMTFTNGFPMDVNEIRAQYYPLDGEPFTLFSGISLPSGTYAGLNEITPSTSQNLITLTRDQLGQMREGGSIALELTLRSYDGQQVKFGGSEFIGVHGILDGTIEVSYR